MTQDATHDPLDAWIADRLMHCSRDERLVVAVRLHRMFKARHKYGALDLATELRDWQLNAAQEVADKGFYDDCRYIVEKDPSFLSLMAEIGVRPRPPSASEVALYEANKREPVEPAIASTWDMRDGNAWLVLK